MYLFRSATITDSHFKVTQIVDDLFLRLEGIMEISIKVETF